jgi:uncharacterized protein (DUF952 family)
VEIVHIATPAEWVEAERTGIVAPPSLASEGFVHCSTRDQLPRTLDLVFRRAGRLVVLVLDSDDFVDVRWEGDPEAFPHVYGAVPISAVQATEEVTAPEG